MIVGKMIHVVDSHTAGEPTRIIVGGVPALPGNTIIEKAEYFKEKLDYIRTALFYEPRGLFRGEGALITSPTHSETQLGVFFMNSGSQLVSMCGHGSIGVITAAIEFGMVDVSEPITAVVLDTPAGLVTGYARVRNGTVKSVSIHNVSSFFYQSIVIKVPDVGKIPVDIAYGGAFFAIIKASTIGTSVDLKNVSRFSTLAPVIKAEVNSQIKVHRPQQKLGSTISGVRFYDELVNPTHIKNITIFDEAIDRSPCGAGTSAHLAVLYAKGRINLHQECIHESLIGTTFKSKIISQTKVNGFNAVIPEITGSAYTTGINTFILSPDDPLKNGFLIKN